jgi:hypothetical protein
MATMAPFLRSLKSGVLQAKVIGPGSAPFGGRDGRVCLPDRLDTHFVERDPVLLVNVDTVADLLALTP